MRAEREETARALRERLRSADAEIEVPDGLWERVRATRGAVTVVPAPPVRRRPGPLVLIAVAAAAVALVVSGTWWLVSPASGPAPGESTAPPAGSGGGPVTLRVYNVEKPCRELRTLECSLRIARNPYTLYADPDNAAGRVWHGDRLTAACVVTDGRLVTDEKGISSTRWYRVEKAEGGDGGRLRGWLPGVRTRNTTEVPVCPADERPDRSGEKGG